MSLLGNNDTMDLFIQQVRYEAENIHSYVLIDPAGKELPQFTPGAHIDVHLPSGVVRQYSLCNSPDDRKRYVIAVLREDKGRGGSKSIHETLHVGDTLRVSAPRNHFELAHDSKRVVLLAGGIGITPLKAMAHHLQQSGTDFELHYCAKAECNAAFLDELATLSKRGRLHLHFDGGDPSKGLDLNALLGGSRTEDEHLYYCGPSGFMAACAQAAADWPQGTVHCEYFKAPEPVSAAPSTANESADGERGFDIEIASTGTRLSVTPSQSIVEVLRTAGIFIDTSCESGLCATCKLRYLQGDVDHRDYILSDQEHESYLTACVSRAKSDVLVLDL